MSVEGGVPGNQQRLSCPKCGKVFFAWRPDEGPAQKIKCYFCRHEFSDEAAQRPAPAAPPPPPAPAPGEGTQPDGVAAEATSPPPVPTPGEGTQPDGVAAEATPPPPAPTPGEGTPPAN